MKHPWVERTSPKGTPFVGTCQSCGATGLAGSATQGECTNPAKMTNEQALVGAIGGMGENPDDVDYSETEAELSVPEGEAGLRVLAYELLQNLANVERASEALKQAEARLAAVAERRLPDLMQELSILKYTFVDPNDGKTHVIKYVEKIRTSMADLTEEQKAAVFAWLREQGLGGIIKKKVEANIGLVPDAEVIKLIEAIQSVAPECETTIAEKVEPSTLTATVDGLMKKGVNISEFIKVTPVRKATAGKK